MGTARKEQLWQVVEDISERLPQPFDIPALEANFEHSTNDNSLEVSLSPFSIALLQESMKLNQTIAIVRSWLNRVEDTIKGESISDETSEQVIEFLTNSITPRQWIKITGEDLVGSLLAS